MKFKCKPAIDTIFVRFGDALAALTIWFGTHIIILSDRDYFLFNVVLILIWMGGAIALVREHRKLTEANAAAGGG
jgi:AAA family ATP:ADP antiporter